MRQTIRVNEYYDLFDVKKVTTQQEGHEPVTEYKEELTNVPATIKDTQQTNPFRGFWNNEQYNTQQLSYDNTPITGQIKSPQAQNSLRIDDNGDIWCYPPNVSVPYWSHIIFRNYDYSFSNVPNGNYKDVIDRRSAMSFSWCVPPTTPYVISGSLADYATIPLPEVLWDKDNSDEHVIQGNPLLKHDYSNVKGYYYNGLIYNNTQVPLFLRFDEYPSRSKVIFSNCDKTRNPDIDFRFAYKKGQMEPIKLNLSLSANTPIRDPSKPSDIYNYNLSKLDINSLIQSCYWCIEWIYEPETH